MTQNGFNSVALTAQDARPNFLLGQSIVVPSNIVSPPATPESV